MSVVKQYNIAVLASNRVLLAYSPFFVGEVDVGEAQ